MILAPSLMSLFKEDPISAVKAIAKAVSEKLAGVVILVQSEARSKQWSDIATLAMGDEVATAVKDLCSGKSKGPYVFPGRYDGIDLAGETCRLLVLDGLPSAANTYARFRAEVLRENSSINVSLAQRVEQGMGRATRGAGDHCVVFLVGSDLTSWVTRAENLALVTPSTKAQVEMGYDISKSIKTQSDLMKTVSQCFNRDRDWVRYHAETLADQTERPQVDDVAIKIALAERQYVRCCYSRDFEKAIAVVVEAAEKTERLDARMKGWLLQLGARAAHLAGEHPRSQELQKAAFAANNLLMPPQARIRYEPMVDIGAQVGNILDEVSKFALRKGVQDEFEKNVSMLTPAATSNVFEEALRRFGELLGFKGQRPEREYRVGPDVLWLAEKDAAFVIECKHRKESKNPLTKDEHGQLLTSVQWFKPQYPRASLTAFIIHPNANAAEPAVARTTHVMTMGNLGKLIAATREFFADLCQCASQGATLERKCAELLTKYNLTPTALATTFLDLFASPAAVKKGQ